MQEMHPPMRLGPISDEILIQVKRVRIRVGHAFQGFPRLANITHEVQGEQTVEKGKVIVDSWWRCSCMVERVVQLLPRRVIEKRVKLFLHHSKVLTHDSKARTFVRVRTVVPVLVPAKEPTVDEEQFREVGYERAGDVRKKHDENGQREVHDSSRGVNEEAALEMTD